MRAGLHQSQSSQVAWAPSQHQTRFVQVQARYKDGFRKQHASESTIVYVASRREHSQRWQAAGGCACLQRQCGRHCEWADEEL